MPIVVVNEQPGKRQKVEWLPVPQAEWEAKERAARQDVTTIYNHYMAAYAAISERLQPPGGHTARSREDVADAMRLFKTICVKENPPNFEEAELAEFKPLADIYAREFGAIHDYVKDNERARCFTEHSSLYVGANLEQAIHNYQMYDLLDTIDSRIVAQPGRDLATIAKREKAQHTLQLQAWTQSLATHGVAFDAQRAFDERTQASQSVLVSGGVFLPINYHIYSPKRVVVGSSFSPVEKYHFGFGFVGVYSKEEGDNKFTRAAYYLDKRIMDVLQKLNEKGSLAEDILCHFHSMASMANHDYVHGTVDNFNTASRNSPLGKVTEHSKMPWDELLELNENEMYAFVTHRQTMQHLFATRPGMKDSMVQKGVEFVGLMEKLRQQGWQHAGLSPAKAQEMSEFLLQNFMQRMATIINPDDKAMQPMREAVERFGVTPRVVTQADIVKELRRYTDYSSRVDASDYIYDTLKGNGPERAEVQPIPGDDAALFKAAMAGDYADHPSGRLAGTASMWRTILPHAQQQGDSYTLSGYDAMRSRVGGLFQMVHDRDYLTINGKKLTMPEITQAYLQEFMSVSRSLPSKNARLLEADSQAVAKLAGKRTQAQQKRLEMLHIGALQAFVEPMQELAKPHGAEALAVVERFGNALAGAERTARFMPRQEEQWDAANKTKAANDMLALAKTCDDELAQQMRPHIEAFEKHITNRKKLPKPIER